jgi:hypothetical protein
LAHAPDRLHEEISADYVDMIYARRRRKSKPAARLSFGSGGSSTAVADSLEEADERLFAFVCRQVNGRAPWSQDPAGLALLLLTSPQLELTSDHDNEYMMIDTTIVRAHQHSAGARKKTARKRSVDPAAD